MHPQEVKRVAIVGAGVMGHSIAQVFAQAGIEVNLVDLQEEILEHALQMVKGNLRTLADHGKVDPQDIPDIIEAIHPTTELAVAAKEVDFALEAVAEIPEVKKKVFKELEDACPGKTVLASNTSGLEIFNIADVKDPSRLVVAHWFAPPHIIPLVEVVPGPKTALEVVQFTAKLMERIGKRPLIMKRFVPRFIVNRIQNAIIFSALEMMENDWATPEEIDLAVKMSLGIRLPIVGVLQSLDFTGLKLVDDVLKSLGMRIPLIEDKVKQEYLGAKTSRGIYDYGGRSEEEILRKRDGLYLKMLDHLEALGAFNPV